MGISYSPTLFDGQSLFERPLRRKPIYVYGYEESISSLDTDLIKVQYSLKKKKCWAFDLSRDPDEKNPLDCSEYQDHLEGLRDFVREHDMNLVHYNTSLAGVSSSFLTPPPARGK
jgi:hypothetical protein